VGHYADQNGWQLVIADAHRVNEFIRSQFPNTPIVMLGHSMGSFITQGYLIHHGRTVNAVVLSGSAMNSPMSVRSARMLAHLEKLRSGAKGRSNLIDMATFSSYNRQIAKQPRTTSDWLSRDCVEVDKYVGDPLCGFLCTNQLWLDFTSGLEAIGRSGNIRKIPADLPFYLMSGERDPLSFDNSRHGIERLAEHLRNGGIRDVSVRLFEDARHEIFNELNRQEVISDMLDWLEPRFPLRDASKKSAAMA
jgi:alpha-beta hydrolase superfamily lysophospholipase